MKEPKEESPLMDLGKMTERGRGVFSFLPTQPMAVPPRALRTYRSSPPAQSYISPQNFNTCTALMQKGLRAEQNLSRANGPQTVVQRTQ